MVVALPIIVVEAVVELPIIALLVFGSNQYLHVEVAVLPMQAISVVLLG